MIEPGARIGILGGGQLGRMTAMAAARLGYSCIILAPDEDCIAAAASAGWIRAAYDDRQALDALAEQVDVVTIEFENVPADALRHLAERVPTRPSAAVLEVTQDRLAEKRLVERLGIEVAPYRAVDDEVGLVRAIGELGSDSILKTRRFGYDGKGQARLFEMSPSSAFAAIGAAPALLEQRVDFAGELSVIVARTPSGAMAAYPPVANEHREQILRRTTAPADLPPATAARAVEMAKAIVSALGLEGLVAVEMFRCQDERLLVNELAPRPHNSGHWTIDACHVSQFELLIRAICDLPLGDTTAFASATMDNLIGEEATRWPALLAEPGAHLHLYGKKAIRAGRKMGHVTRLGPLRR